MAAPTYMIARIDVTDLPRYRAEYGALVAAQFASFGAELLVATPDADVLEGEWPGNWTVVVRFPDRAAAEAWYRSPEYAPLKARRINELTQGAGLVFVTGRDAGPVP